MRAKLLLNWNETKADRKPLWSCCWRQSLRGKQGCSLHQCSWHRNRRCPPYSSSWNPMFFKICPPTNIHQWTWKWGWGPSHSWSWWGRPAPWGHSCSGPPCTPPSWACPRAFLGPIWAGKWSVKYALCSPIASHPSSLIAQCFMFLKPPSYL